MTDQSEAENPNPEQPKMSPKERYREQLAEEGYESSGEAERREMES